MAFKTRKVFKGIIAACVTLAILQAAKMLMPGSTRSVRMERWPLFVETGPRQTVASDVKFSSEIKQGNGVASPLSNSTTLPATLHKDSTAFSVSKDAVHNLSLHSKEEEDSSDWFEPMIMGLDYREQIGNALASLFDLQCWARTVNISKVVEPHVKIIKGNDGSVLHYLPNPSLQLNDLLNVTHWNKMSMQHNFATLVPAEHFLKHATREIIFVQIVYRLHPISCLQDIAIKRTGWYKALTASGFHFIKTVCIDFRTIRGNVLTEEAFKELISKDVNRSNVSLLFNVWEGVRANDDFRVALKGSHCSDLLYRMANVQLNYTKQPHEVRVNSSSLTPIVPSLYISKLVEQFLSEFLSKERFIAIMVRTEKMNYKLYNIGNNSCINDILSDWKGMTNANNITKTLFFSDTDKHGSTTLHLPKAKVFTDYLLKSVNAEQEAAMNEYLETIVASKDSVVLAVLTRHIVARATCMMTVGGGLFQRQTLNMFAHEHKEQELCYSVRGGFCRSQYIQTVGDGDHFGYMYSY